MGPFVRRPLPTLIGRGRQARKEFRVRSTLTIFVAEREREPGCEASKYYHYHTISSVQDVRGIC